MFTKAGQHRVTPMPHQPDDFETFVDRNSTSNWCGGDSAAISRERQALFALGDWVEGHRAGSDEELCLVLDSSGRASRDPSWKMVSLDWLVSQSINFDFFVLFLATPRESPSKIATRYSKPSMWFPRPWRSMRLELITALWTSTISRNRHWKRISNTSNAIFRRERRWRRQRWNYRSYRNIFNSLGRSISRL